MSLWVIPENIHTIPRVASWNSEGEGGFLGLEFEGVRGKGSLEFQRHGGGGVSSEFSELPEGRRRKLRLKSKSSTNEPQKQEAEVSAHTDGLCSKVHIKEALKLMNWSID